MGKVREAIYDVLAEEHPMTVRQVFYQLVNRKQIEKTETEYNATVVRLLTELRRAKEIPFGWISDNTRWMRKPNTFDSMEAALQETANFYRRSLWKDQAAYVEVWLEKDALAGVLYEITEQWDVPLMVTRGYPSLTYLHEAGEALAHYHKPAFIYYFGDYDPSGLDIPKKVEAGLRQFAPQAVIEFQRVAVTLTQIVQWGLPTRPTKKTDSRSKDFIGESVEVDAIPPDRLRQLTQDCIYQHVDIDRLETLQIAERSERDILLSIARNGERA